MIQPPKTVEGLLLLVTGPAGSGKSDLCRRLVAAHPEIERLVTCTTRLPHRGEREGIDYHFLSDAQFDAAIADGDLLEWTRAYGNRYGTRQSALAPKLARNTDLVINVDVRGARAFRQALEGDAATRSRLVRVFVTPSDARAVEERLFAREPGDARRDDPGVRAAVHEIEQWTQQDFSIVTESPAEDLARIEGIWRAEKCRVTRLRHVATLSAPWLRIGSIVPFENEAPRPSDAPPPEPGIHPLVMTGLRPSGLT